MKKVVSTRGISYHIEQIISKAKEEIILITPFLKLPPEFHERLLSASDKGVKITIVYGKKELDRDQEKLLREINNLELRYLKNLHAKVYLNEIEGMIASMNLYQYSEINNFELGISFTNDDLESDSIYQDTYHEVTHIITQSELKKDRLCDNLKVAPLQIFDEEMKITEKIFYSEDSENMILEDFPIKGIDISKRYGFVTYHIKESLMPYQSLESFRSDTIDLIFGGSFRIDYRPYWSYPYDKICIYPKKDIKFTNEKEELEYCNNFIKAFNLKIKEVIGNKKFY